MALKRVGVGAGLISPHTSGLLAVGLQGAHHFLYMFFIVDGAQAGKNVQGFLVKIKPLILKAIGKQQRHPALLKRGFGITLNESLNAAEYLASEGNSQVIFCLRGMKSDFGAPHRNLVDFAQVPTIKRLTRMPVCIDPSHSVGSRERAPDGVLELCHATSQGIAAGANMVLVDFHPAPEKALVDGPQAMLMNELEPFLKDVEIAREAYLKRCAVWQ